jgi:PAS domain S-box-containing protein
MNSIPAALNVIAMDSYDFDVNNKSKAERKGNHFEYLFSSAPDFIYTVDIDGRFRYVNNRSMLLTGFTPDELQGKSYLELVSPFHRERVQNFYVEQIVEQTQITYIEFPILTKPGVEIWVGQSVTFLADHEESGFQAIMKNVSEKHAQEEQLHWTQGQCNIMFEYAVQGMIQSTVNGRIVSVNSALLKLLAYDSVAELKNMNMADLYNDPEDRTRVSTILDASGRSYNVETRLKRKDGTIVTVLEHSRVIKDITGNITMYEETFENITSLRRVEESLQHYITLLKELQERLNDFKGMV